jgi:hypothetical protein
MVDMYMANGGSLEEFLDQYKEKRKLAHMRRIKIDKMRELLAAKKVRQSDRYVIESSVADPDPDWIQIQSGQCVRIRIREGKNDQ